MLIVKLHYTLPEVERAENCVFVFCNCIFGEAHNNSQLLYQLTADIFYTTYSVMYEYETESLVFHSKINERREQLILFFFDNCTQAVHTNCFAYTVHVQEFIE